MKVFKMKDETFQKLVKRGTYGDTVDSIISRLLENASVKEVSQED